MMKMFLMKPADDNGGDIGDIKGSFETNTPPEDFYKDTPSEKPPGEADGNQTPAGDTKPPGYEAPVEDDKDKKPAADDKKPAGDTKPPGYDKPPGDEKPATDDKKPAGDDTKPVEFSVEGLEENAAKAIKDFAATAKLSKEQAEALVKREKDSAAAQATDRETRKTEFEAEIKKVKAGWYKELQEDPTFGGQNFDQNLHNVEKVLSSHFPTLKKDLTDNGRMLPPSVMRELAALHKTLYGTPSLVNGDAKGTSNDDEFGFLDEMYKG